MIITSQYSISYFFDQHKYLLCVDFPDNETRCLCDEHEDGYKYTIFYNNKLNIHSIDKPTTVSKCGSNSQYIQYFWFNNGKLHREDDKPAVSIPYADYWYQYGRLHRENKPAIIDRNQGDNKLEYYYNGVRHRADGPAIEYIILSKYNTLVYYYYGQECSEDEFNDKLWRQRQELIYYES